MPRENILSLDPGVTTGFVDYLYVDGIRSYYRAQVRFDGLKPKTSFYEYLQTYRPDKIIYESFQHRQGQLGTVTTGVMYIGIIELHAEQLGIETIIINPSDGKGF